MRSAQEQRRLNQTGSKAYAYTVTRKRLTPAERATKAILRKNKSYFEEQPVVFNPILKIHISPDFFILSWHGTRLKTPCYLEVDWEYKDLEDAYQIKRVEGLKYPVLRIKNNEVSKKNIKALMDTYINGEKRKPMADCKVEQCQAGHCSDSSGASNAMRVVDTCMVR